MVREGFKDEFSIGLGRYVKWPCVMICQMPCSRKVHCATGARQRVELSCIMTRGTVRVSWDQVKETAEF